MSQYKQKDSAGTSVSCWITGLLLLITLYALQACATPKHRAKDYQAFMDELEPDVREKILKGEIQTGMPTEAAVVAFGEPSYKAEGVFREGNTKTWVYSHGISYTEPRIALSSFRTSSGEVVHSQTYDPVRRYNSSPYKLIFIRDGQIVGWQDL